MISEDFDESLNRLYLDPSSVRRSPFIHKNAIVINPKAISEIMIMIEEDFSLPRVARFVEHLNSIIEKVPQNSISLFQSSANYDQKQHGDNILDFLIQTYFRVLQMNNTQLMNKISELVSNLLNFNNAAPRNFTKIYRENSVQFYSGNVSSAIFSHSVKLLQDIFSKYTPLTQEPQNFFYFSYNRAGIKVNNPNKSLQWPFSNGLCLCFWFYLEEYEGPAEKEHPQKLFTIHCLANGGGGIEAYFLGYNLYYRVLPMNYTNPSTGSNGVLIGEYMPKTWYFLGLEHERAKTFGRAFLNIYINQKFYKNYNIEYPKISADLEISNLTFGDHLFGRVSTIMIFNSTIGKKLGDFYSFFNFGIQNSSGLKNLKIILETLMPKLYLLYIPTRSSNTHCFDLINNNDGIFLENTGVTWKDNLKMKMSFSGGMSSILPFFYLLRFCDNKEFPNLLNDLLKLLIILLRNKAENQADALKLNFFQIIGQHLCELNCNFFNHETLEAFAELKHVIHEQKLIDQLFTDIIWNIDVLENCQDYATFNEYFKYIRSFYLEKPQHYLTLFGISDILEIALDKFDIKNLTCCETHSLALGLNIEKSANTKSKNNWKVEEIIKPILSIVEVIMINGGDTISNDFIQILRTFNSKSSPCFLIHLFQLLKTILIDRAEENSVGNKIMMRLLNEHNFMLTLVYLISTSPCLDIKAMSIKFINFLINQKIQSTNEKELSTYISFIMWNLNLPKKQIASISIKPATPTQSDQKKPPLDLLGKPSPQPLSRKSCKPPLMTLEDNPLNSDHKANRSRSLDSGPTSSSSKFYQRDLINEKKKSVIGPQIASEEKNLEKNAEDIDDKNGDNLDISSSNSSQNKEPVDEIAPTKEEKEEKQEEAFPFGKKVMIQVEDEKEDLKNDEIFQQDIKNLGTQFLNNDYENIPQAPSMSNKRKPKTMDFGFSTSNQNKKSFDFQSKAPSKTEDPKKTIEPKTTELEQGPIKKEETSLKPSLKPKKPMGKFNLNLKEDIIEESIAASEKITFPKEKKSPQILINAVPQINVIRAENEDSLEINKPKATSVASGLKPPTQKKTFGGKKNLGPILMIDTDQINEIYSFGGEKGKKIVVNMDELSEEYREIAELAVMCVRYMRGELKNDDYFANKMPVIKKFDAPQSVRGLKTVSFPDKAVPPSKSKFNKELTTIKENSMSFDTDMNLSNSIDINKNSIEETSNSFKYEKRDSINENKITSFSNEYEVETLDCSPLYNSLMEWVLRKTPSNLELQITIDDTDKIDSNFLLQLIMAFYRNCSHELKPKILQDVIMLIKWNQSNCNALLDSQDFSFWLVEVLLHQQILFLDPDTKNSTTILDFGTKIFGILSKHAINTYSNGYEKILAIVKHLQTIAIDKKGATEEEKKASLAAKYLLRHLFSNILDSLIDLSKSSRPNISNNFWKNLMNLVFLTQEIVFFTYEQYDFEVLKENPFLKVSCNIIKNENEIPQNFKKNFAENKWLDFKIVENLFKVLDSLWPEIFPQKTKFNMEDIQKKIVNLLDYINASEYAKDLEIFLYEAYPNHEAFKKRGTVIKVVNILLSIYLELSFTFDKSNNISLLLDKQSKILKYFLVVCENVRDNTLSNFQQSTIISNIVFPFHWLYSSYEKFKENEKIASLLINQIEDLVMFKIYLLDQINSKIGGFQNYNELKVNMFANLYISNQIPISNLFTYEIFTNLLLNQNNETILPYSLYENSKKSKFAELDNFIFSKDWKFAYLKQKLIFDLLQANYEEDFRKYFPFILRSLEAHLDTSRKFLKFSEKSKDILRIKYENDIYEQNLTVLEEEDLRKQNDIFLSEKKYRFNKYTWDKIWKKVRTHHGTWMHPDFSTQNDRKFDQKDFEYDKLTTNEFFYYKIWKYELKNRSRPFLKIKLKEPDMVGKNREEEKNKKHSLLNNYQTILHMSPLKSLNIETKPQSSSNITQQNEETAMSGSGLLQPNSSRTNKSKFISDVRKNITNSIKAIQSKALPFLNYYKSDDIYLQKRCQWIKTLSLRNGVLTVTSEKLIFHFDSLEQKESHLAFVCYKLAENRPFFKEWPLENIREIQRRRYILRKTALEVFFIDGSSMLFNFPDSDNEDVSQKLIRLRKTKCVNLQYNKTLDAKKLIDKSGVLKKWLNYEISNFDYLMLLNGLAGRSYKDVTQYPVFPWILINTILDKIDHENPAIFRDLSKTMGAMGNPERIKLFIERFEHNDPYSQVPSFHFGSHYSSPAIIFHYLIRLFPYNLGAKELQSGKFDLPDRLFFDLEDSFRCATEEISDVRELIPEFFYMPEFCLNLEKHDLGVQTSGNRVHNLKLPKWAHANPYFFICMHRICLESDYVSRNLHNWIDLIFGYKQRGKEAEKSLNTFYYMTYEDSVEIDKIDPNLKISTEAQIMQFGQTPSQLFLKNHPARPSKESLLQGKWISDPAANLKIYKPSNKKKSEDLTKSPKLKKKTFFTLEGKAIIKMRFISESKIFTLRKNGVLSSFRWWNQALNTSTPPPQTMAMIPFSCATDKDKQLNYERLKNEVFNTIDTSLVNPIFPVQFLNMGKILVCGGHWDGKLVLISTETDSIIEIYNQHIETITVIEEDPKENFLITGSKNGECIYWRITPEYKLQPKYTLYDHDDEITSCFISREMRVFATSSKNGKIFIYNLMSGLLMKSFKHPKNLSINNVILSCCPIACVIFYSQQEKMIYCYSINGQFLESAKEPSNFLVSPLIIKWMNGIDLLVYGNEFGEVIFRDLPDLKERKKAAVSVSGPVLSMMQSKDKRFLLFGCSDGELTVMTDPNINKSPGLHPHAQITNPTSEK